MSYNKAADRLFQYSLALLLVFVSWGNTLGLIVVSLVLGFICAFFAIRYRDSLSRTGRITLIVSILTSTALAVIAWKG